MWSDLKQQDSLSEEHNWPEQEEVQENEDCGATCTDWAKVGEDHHHKGVEGKPAIEDVIVPEKATPLELFDTLSHKG